MFSSDHTDWCHKNTVIGKCKVHTLRKYESLPNVSDHDYFTRFHYKPAKREFEPDRVPVYCNCEMPYNPDKAMIMCDTCEEWYHPECINLGAEALRKQQFVCKECSKAPNNLGASCKRGNTGQSGGHSDYSNSHGS